MGKYVDVSQHSKQVIKYRQKNLCLTLEQIGTKFDVSRERVRQILARSGVETKNIRFGKHLAHICPYCGGKKGSSVVMCHKCSSPKVTVACDECGKLIERSYNELRWRLTHGREQKQFFCSRECHGRYIAKRYGFQITTLRTNDKGETEKHCYKCGLWKSIDQFYKQKGWCKECSIKYVTEYRCSHPRIPKKKITHVSYRFPVQHIRARHMRHLNFTEREIVGYLHCSKGTVHRAGGHK